jgi:hypothetical protein
VRGLKKKADGYISKWLPLGSRTIGSKGNWRKLNSGMIRGILREILGNCRMVRIVRGHIGIMALQSLLPWIPDIVRKIKRS